MRTYLENHLMVALGLTLTALAIVMGVITSHIDKKEFVTNLERALTAQRSYLHELAEIADRNGADDTTAAIITDCARRSEYEGLLVRLGSLPKQELISFQNLFESCGTFYAERKALMVSVLRRETEHYASLASLYRTLVSNVASLDEETWRELVELEEMRSTLLHDQSELQGKIITELITGSSPGSAQVQALVRDAQEIHELLSVQDHRIDGLREKLQN